MYQNKSSPPVVSVIIVNWNACDFLNQTLQTLYRQTSNLTFETIVVDNGSTDGSIELIQQIWKQVHLIALSKNMGFGAANNVGFQAAKGSYILVLNSDTIVLPTTLHGMANFLKMHPDAGCVGCKHLNPDGTLQRSVDNFPTLLHDFLCFSDLYRLPILQGRLRQHYAWWGPHDKIRNVDWVNGSCFMVRREVIDQTGGFDTDFFIYAEEIEWCYRIWKAGWKIYFTPEAEIIHFGGQSSKRVINIRLVLIYQGQYRFYRKHYPVWKYLVLRIIIILIAFPRIILLLSLSLFKKRLNGFIWTLLTQESVQMEPFSMVRSWWRIIWISPDKRTPEEKRLMSNRWCP